MQLHEKQAFIRAKAAENRTDPSGARVFWSRHAIGEAIKESLTRVQVERALELAEIIEDYPVTHRVLPDCLTLAWLPGKRPLHAVVAVDEAQFFDENIAEVVDELADRGLRVIVAGPATHLVLAFLFFALWLGFVGQPTSTSPLVAAVAPTLDGGVRSPAAVAGIRPGDRIVGIITTGKGVTIHTIDCATLESFSEAALCSQNKTIKPPQYYKDAVAAIHRHGIVVEAGLIFGFDTDSPDVFQSTLGMLDEMGIDAMQASILTPLPGTQLFERMRGRIVDWNWEHYDYKRTVFEPAQMSRRDLDADGQWDEQALSSELYRVAPRTSLC